MKRPVKFFAGNSTKYLGNQVAKSFGSSFHDQTINIRLVIGLGKYEALAWGCDLSDQYVRINADYTT